jgi:hypothetical protein
MEQEAKVPQSPAWWLNYLMARFNERDHTFDVDLAVPNQKQRPARRYLTRRQRMNLLWSYYIGSPPLPQVVEGYSHTFQEVLRKARACLAPIAIQSILDRMTVNGVSTTVDSDPEGDDIAADIFEKSNLKAAIKDALAYLFVMSESYLMAVPADPDALDKTPLITAEDPRWCIGEPDQLNPNQLRAAVKIGFDPVLQVEKAWLFLDGKRYEASRKTYGLINTSYELHSAAGFEWDGPPTEMPEIAGVGPVPIVRFVNARGMGEFEPNLDLLDRINDTILQRIVITWYQSFRQRAIIGDEEGEDEGDDPEDISLDDVFKADPGALWRVPKGFTFWESSITDINGVLQSIINDMKEFALCTGTPMYMVIPDSANQTAQGTEAQQEGVVNKATDRRDRTVTGLHQVMRYAFAFAGVPQRADGMRILWGPLKLRTLAEMSDAVSKTKGLLSRERQMVTLLNFTPDEAAENNQELLSDQLLDAQLTVAPPPANIRLTENVTEKAPGQAQSASGQPAGPVRPPAVP